MYNIRTYDTKQSEQKTFHLQYADSSDYLLGGALTLKNGRIDKYQFEEGYCQAKRYNNTMDDFTFCYYDKDHLGDIRQVTEADGSKKGTIIQKMNYYPFGAEFCDASADSLVQPYKYNGKELDRMHGLNTYDYGARQYNPVTARWDRMDPLCEKYYSTSPYAYCMNNPVSFIDPNGMEIYVCPNNERSQETMQLILGFIKEITGGKEGEYAFNEKGFLHRTAADYTGNENGKLIDEAINDKKNMLQITLDNEIPDGKGGKKSTDEYCGAAVSPAIPLKKNGKITGEKYVMALDDKYPREDLSYKDIIKGDKLNYDLFDSFIHELFGHAIPAMKHQMGDAIELENVARGRIGKIGRQLEQDPNGKTKHPTIKTEN